MSVAALVLGAQVGELFEEAELPTIDTRFRVRGTEQPPAEVLVVGIDEVTLQQLGEPWPFSLDTYARAVEALTEGGAAVIALDVAAGRDAQAERFLAALDDAPAVTLSAVRPDSDGRPIVLGGTEAAAIDGVRTADGRFEPDDDGVVRRFDHTFQEDDDDDDDDDDDGEASQDVAPVAVLGVATLPVVVVEQATGVSLSPSVTGSEGATIDLPGPTGTIDQVSFISVVDGQVPADRLDGRIVVVGPTARELQAPVETSLSEATSRAELHAAAIDTLLRDIPLRTPATPVRLALTLIACLTPILTVRLNVFRGLSLVFALALGWLVVAQVAFNSGWILPVVAPVVGLVGAAVATVGVDYVFEVRARQRVREVFGRFVPPEVVRDLIDADPQGDLLRATNREVTILFSDLRGFTTFSETRNPHEVVSILNEYLAAVTDVLVDADAVVDYLGDGVMAVFGVPTEHADHADRAVAAGLGVLEATRRFDREMADRLDGARFRVGIGINTGKVTAGNLGTIRRLKYTVIGDAVNTAARIEAMTKDAPYDLLMAESTRALLSEQPEDLVEHATLPVRGRSEPVQLWSIGRAAAEAEPAD